MVSCQTEIGAIIAIVCLWYVQSAAGQETPCSINQLDQCERNETCEQTYPNNSSGLCKCKPGYARADPRKKCLSSTVLPDTGSTTTPSPASLPTTHSYKSHIAAGILIPLALVALIVGVLYASRRYQWIQRLRALRQRRYDEVQFGQEEDDPPLA